MADHQSSPVLPVYHGWDPPTAGGMTLFGPPAPPITNGQASIMCDATKIFRCT